MTYEVKMGLLEHIKQSFIDWTLEDIDKKDINVSFAIEYLKKHLPIEIKWDLRREVLYKHDITGKVTTITCYAINVNDDKNDISFELNSEVLETVVTITIEIYWKEVRKGN